MLRKEEVNLYLERSPGQPGYLLCVVIAIALVLVGWVWTMKEVLMAHSETISAQLSAAKETVGTLSDSVDVTKKKIAEEQLLEQITESMKANLNRPK